jgi:hypothetical protein
MNMHCGKVFSRPMSGGRIEVCTAPEHAGQCYSAPQAKRREEPRFHWRGGWAYCDDFEAELTIDGQDYLVRGIGSVPERPHRDNADSTIREVLVAGDDDWELLPEDKWPNERKLEAAFDEAAADAFDRMRP